MYRLALFILGRPRARRVLFIAALLLAPAASAQTREELLREQREEKRSHLAEPEEPGTLERGVRWFEERTEGAGSGGRPVVQPLFGGLDAGAGPTVGLSISPSAGPSHVLRVDGRISARRYWGLQGLAGYRSGGWQGGAFAEYRHLADEPFYGLGPETDGEVRLEYRLDEALGGVVAGRRFGAAAVGVQLSYRHAWSGLPASMEITPPILPAPLPELRHDAGYVVPSVWFEVDSRELPARIDDVTRFAPVGRLVRGLSLVANDGYYLSGEVVRHGAVVGTGQLTTMQAEAQQYWSFRNGFHGFAFREALTTTLTRDEAPFYLLPALGGSRSLRGYDEARFRDENAWLVTAEYRWYVWLFLQMAAFVDAGQVFGSPADLDLEQTAVSYGLGLRFASPTRFYGRVDAARSAEGLRYYASIGAFL